MKELGITKGEWKEVELPYKIGMCTHEIQFGEDGECVTDGVYGKANAKLIADAGTTANKCNLLPSELLDRYNEAIEVLQDLASECNKWATFNTGRSKKQFEKALQTISKANR